jgi:hypothetical protein
MRHLLPKPHRRDVMDCVIAAGCWLVSMGILTLLLKWAFGPR